MLKSDIGEPTENQAIISVGRELRRLVEQNGTILHLVKVKGHSEDVINDKADELATDGMHKYRVPRQLKYKQIVSHHYDRLGQSRGTTANRDARSRTGAGTGTTRRII